MVFCQTGGGGGGARGGREHTTTVLLYAVFDAPRPSSVVGLGHSTEQPWFLGGWGGGGGSRMVVKCQTAILEKYFFS